MLTHEECDEKEVAQRLVDNILQVVHLDPDNTDMLLALADAYCTLDRNEEAIETYCRILFLEPFRDDARFNLGATVMKTLSNGTEGGGTPSASDQACGILPSLPFAHSYRCTAV